MVVVSLCLFRGKLLPCVFRRVDLKTQPTKYHLYNSAALRCGYYAIPAS